MDLVLLMICFEIPFVFNNDVTDKNKLSYCFGQTLLRAPLVGIWLFNLINRWMTIIDFYSIGAKFKYWLIVCQQPQYPAYPHHGVPAYPGIQGTYPGGSQPQVVVVQAQSYPATDINGKPIDSVKPVQANCQSCHKTVRTRVQDSIRDLGWIWCIACCLLTGWCWVALLACCMNGFK